jgi:signal transduction histidine kinase
MDRLRNYERLEEAFVATFLDELIPGIFHNYANPLNGIMGRSKLLQRRLDDFMQALECAYPEAARGLAERCRKILSDIHSINQESEKFYDLFRLSTGKFYALGTTQVEALDLSALLEAELGFADFYLDFKHQVSKNIALDRQLPPISGVAAHYSMAFWMLLRLAMTPLKGARDRSFNLSTGLSGGRIFVRINPISPPGRAGGTDAGNPADGLPAGEGDAELRNALSLLREGGEGIEISHDGDETLTVSIPCRQGRGGGRD